VNFVVNTTKKLKVKYLNKDTFLSF